jgi:hypothetical protein
MKTLLFTFALFFVSICRGQEFPYALTTFTDPYQPLSEAISVTPEDDPAWDDPEDGAYLIPIGFTFDMMGQTADQVVLIDPGCQVVMAVETDSVNALSPYFADVRNADTLDVVSHIFYATEGMPGSRIFKLEWSNVGFYNEFDATGEFHSIANYQVWFYEGTNDIELRYGPNTITDGTLIHDAFGSPLIFFLRDFDVSTQTIGDSWNLRGEPSDPAVGPIDLYSMPELDEILLGEPMDSIVYHFDTGMVGVQEQRSDEKFSVFPSIADRHINTFWSGQGKVNLEIYDLMGNKVSASMINTGNDLVDISNLATGTYLARITDGRIQMTRRFIKK